MMEDETEEVEAAVNWRERLLCLLIGLFVGTLLTVGVLTANRRVQPTPIIIEPAPPLPTATMRPEPTMTATAAPLTIYVSGAVEQSGVYSLPVGARIVDAVEAAGGFGADAATVQVNLAQPLGDGDQVHIPFVTEVVELPPLVQTAVPAVTEEAEVKGGPAGSININEASAAELETLPGVGPSTANQIITFREANGPFDSTEAIMDVPGIGPAKFAGFAELITVGE